MRSRGNSGRSAVKCPKCSTAIPLPSDGHSSTPRAGHHQAALPPSPPKRPTNPGDSDDTADDRPKASDAQLRKMLLRAKRKRSDESNESRVRGGLADRTIPDLKTPPSDDTDPDYGMDVTMPIGRGAVTAAELGTDSRSRGDFGADRAGERVGAATIKRTRHDTPRAGAKVPAPSLRAPSAPPAIERPVVDEPTYTGPMPGRTPHITPSGSDLSRFLEPGDYLVRVEDSVYEPVSEKDLVRLLNAGVFFAIDELCPKKDNRWIPISSPELFADLKGRLAHRAHHMLARVVKPQPASDFGRPAPDEPEPPPVEQLSQPQAMPQPAFELSTSLGEPSEPVEAPPTQPSVIVDEEAAVPEQPTAPSKKRLLMLVVPLVMVLGVVFVGIIAMVVPGATDWMAASSDGATLEDIDAGNLEVLGKNDGPADPVPAFQSAFSGVAGAHAYADSIDGMLSVANEVGDEEASMTLAFEKWKRQPSSVEARPLIEKLMARKRWQAARQVANWTAVSDGDSDELTAVINTSLEKQFQAEEEALEISTDRFTRIVRVDPGHRPALILQDTSGAQWTVWPDLGEREWRNDIAVYRLCQLIVCHFRIAETREVVLSKKTLRKLADASDAGANEMTTKLLPDFAWGGNGEVSGSIRPLPTGAPWPIELSQIWRPWLTAGSGLAPLQDDVREAHHQFAFFGAERVYPELQGVSARQLARQVSSILLVDYLVNNWNRFAPNEENWGSRTNIDDGLVYSVEDSAAFFDGDSVRVRGRFSWSKRFSRATVESLKNLKEDRAEQLLFPNATKAEKDKLDDLWQQRTRALRRISKLVKKYGADDVYALDGASR